MRRTKLVVGFLAGIAALLFVVTVYGVIGPTEEGDHNDSKPWQDITWAKADEAEDLPGRNMDDTPYYEYGPLGDGPEQQQMGDIDKIGVHADVVSEYPNRQSDFELILAQKSEREAQLTVVPSDHHWHLTCFRVVQHEDEDCYEITAILDTKTRDVEPEGGGMVIIPGTPAAACITELWRIGEIGHPKLVQRIKRAERP